MRGPGSGNLGGVLAGLWQQARIGGAVDFRTRGLQPVEYPGSGRRRIHLYAAALRRESVERRTQVVGRQDGHPVAEMAFDPGDEFAAVDKQTDRAVLAQDCE
jgi:hypothetical protein